MRQLIHAATIVAILPFICVMMVLAWIFLGILLWDDYIAEKHHERRKEILR